IWNVLLFCIEYVPKRKAIAGHSFTIVSVLIAVRLNNMYSGINTVVYNIMLTIRSVDVSIGETSSQCRLANSQSFSGFSLTVICFTSSQVFNDVARMTISLNLSDSDILLDNTVYSHANSLTDVSGLRVFVTNITLCQASGHATDDQCHAVSYVNFPVFLNMCFHTFFGLSN